MKNTNILQQPPYCEGNVANSDAFRVERDNSRLKDSVGLCNVHVQRQEKVHFHAMLGV
jgi:hypothetical protein